MFSEARHRFTDPARVRVFAWAAAAVLSGILAAFLPVLVTAGLLAGAALLVVILVEPVLALILMLSLAPLKTLIATEAPIALPLDVGQMGLGLALFAWLATRQRGQPLPRTRLYLPLLIIMLGFVPSLFVATSSGAWLSEFLKWVEMLLLVALVVAWGSRWTWIAFGVVLAATLQALIGLYEFMGGSGAPHLWIAGYRFFRAFGTFGQPNPFSAFMGLVLPLALGLAWGHVQAAWNAWRERPRYVRAARVADWWMPVFWLAFYGGSALLILAGLLASWGRGAWLGFGAAGVVMVFFAPRRRWQGAVLVAAGGVLVLMLWWAGLVPLSIQQRVDNALTEFTGFGDMRGVPISDENYAIVERLAHWQAAYNMANDHPFTGVGLGNYEVVYPAYGLPSWPLALGHAHNDYLNLLAETGMIGLAGYLFGWLVIGVWSLRALAVADPVLRGMVLGLLGTWTHLMVHSVVDKLYVNNLFLHIGVLLGLLAVACTRSWNGNNT